MTLFICSYDDFQLRYDPLCFKDYALKFQIENNVGYFLMMGTRFSLYAHALCNAKSYFKLFELRLEREAEYQEVLEIKQK